MKKTNIPGISRIDSKHTHGWYVRVYANGGVFISKLFSDRLYGGKQEALTNAIKFRDHNQMVAALQTKDGKTARKPFYERKPKNNTSGTVGVNEVITNMHGRKIHYFQATWSEDGKPRSKKFYVCSKRNRDEARELAIKERRQKEKELRQQWQKDIE